MNYNNIPATCDSHCLLFESKARPEEKRGAVVDELAQAQAEAAQLQDRDEVMHLDSTLTRAHCPGNLHVYWHVMLVVVLPRLLLTD